jgi:ribonuclease HII
MRERPSLELERAFWRDGYASVAGLDEVGRGALAGPVVAAAVILPPLDAAQARAWYENERFIPVEGANDSKQLTEKKRESLYAPICALCRAYAAGSASHEEIDALGIARASRLAMQRALGNLSLTPEALLLDALVLPELESPQVGLVHGDALSLSIAVASIVAKVTRDRLMRELDAEYPAYHFLTNKGYGTPEHLAALFELGPTRIHRRSYEPVWQALAMQVEGGVTFQENK